MRKLLLGLIAVLACGWLASTLFLSTPPVRVLFIGNSYTFQNDLPAMVADVADANGTDLEVTMIAKGGFFLSQHVQSSAVNEALASGDYDIVVLQEQSVAPAEPHRFETDTLPAVRRFSTLTAESPIDVVLFQTWGHAEGNPISGHRSYETMQEALIVSYATMAMEIDSETAPVGAMWWRARTFLPDVALHSADGSHPTIEGSYLAALVLAEAVTEAPITTAAEGYVDNEVAEQLLDLLN